MDVRRVIADLPAHYRKKAVEFLSARPDPEDPVLHDWLALHNLVVERAARNHLEGCYREGVPPGQ